MFGKHTSSAGTSSVDVNLTLDLTDYVKTEDLTDYLKTEDLSDYVKTEDLTDYVKTEDLDLTDYAKKDDETFTGTTTIDTLAITDSNTTILGESGQLHFDNNDGYYAFHINSYPYLYVTADSCYVNNTLSIDTNEKQIVFYRENNFWYFNTENNGTKLQIKSGTSLSNWNENAFEFYHNGNFKIPGTCESNGIYNTSTLHQGGDASFYDNIISYSLNNQIQIMNLNNFWYFNVPAYSTQAKTNKLMLWPRYSANHPQVEGFGFFQNGDFNAPGIVYAEGGITNSGVLTQYAESMFSRCNKLW